MSRRYPPTIGGIQTHCFNLFTGLGKSNHVRLVALRRPALFHLAWFLPLAWAISVLALLLRRLDVLYFSDGVIGSLAPFLKPFAGRCRFVVTIHGSELTFANALARWLMRFGCSRCDHLVTVSENTKTIALAMGLPAARLSVIYGGISPPQIAASRHDEIRTEFEAAHSVRFGADRVLLNLGRQVHRKGLVAFLENGFERLDDDVRLFIAGSGPELVRLRQVVEARGFAERVAILGAVSDDVAAFLRHSADLFIMPNIPLSEDVEGFGLAPLESMYCGTPVIAFAVDALVESVREGGWLIEAGDYASFAAQIEAYFDLPLEARREFGEKARQYILRECDWNRTADEYGRLFGEIP